MGANGGIRGWVTGEHPGPRWMAGLCWLARVRAAPFDAWRCAVGSAPGVAESHARRLDLADPQLKGQVRWMSRNGCRQHGHRPDLAVVIASGLVAIEVDLYGSSDDHLTRVLSLYERWVASQRFVGVIYNCRSELGAERIARLADHQGLDQLRVELLSTIRAQAEEQARRQPQLPGFKWPDAATA
jgi:hypothetical protein